MLIPKVWFHRITEIPAEFFQKQGIRLVALDVDNTLTTHDNPVPAEGVEAWLSSMQESGIIFVILSNNKAKRVASFAEKLRLPFVARACKPLTFGLTRAMKCYGVKKNEIAIIGDQLFTDVLCGNLKGITSVLVTPFELEKHGFLKTKRILEKPLLPYCKAKKYREE